MPDEKKKSKNTEMVIDDSTDDRYTSQANLSAKAQFCRDLYNEYESSSYRERKFKEMNEGRKRYRLDRDPKTFPWKDCSNISVGLDAIAVDNLEPRIAAQLVGETDFITAEPVGPEDQEGAESATNFLNWAVLNNMKLPAEIKPIVNDLLKDGTKDVIPIWEEETVTNRKRSVKPVYEDENGERAELPDGFESLPPEQLAQLGFTATPSDSFEEEEATRFKVRLEAIPLTDAFFPDSHQNWEDQPYLRLIYPEYGDLLAMSDGDGPYKNITKDLVVDPGRLGDANEDEDAVDEGVKFSEFTKQVRLLECYYKWKGVWRISTFAIDRAWIEVRDQKMSDVYWHGHKPVHRFRLYPQSNKSMGTGIPAKIQHFSKGIDDLFNQMVDSGLVQIIPWFFFNEAPGFENLNLKLAPGKGVPIGKDTNVTFPTLGVTATQILSFIEALLGFFERTVGLSDYTLGRESGTAGKGGETYSGMALIVNEGNIGHQYKGETLRDTFELLLTDVLSLYAQNMPLDAKQRIFENNQWVFRPLDVMSIQGQYDIKIDVSDSSANKMLSRKEAVEKHQMLLGNPVVNTQKTTEDLLRAYGHKDTSEHIRPEFAFVMQAVLQNPEIVQMLQQYMEQKAQQAREQQIAGEAQANVRRQEIEREVEAPSEAGKLVDQVTESSKRKILQPAIEANLRKQLSLPLGGGGE